MEQSQIDLAGRIVNALKTSGRDDVPAADHPGEPPAADAPASSKERYAKAMDAYHSHLQNLPAHALADFPGDSAAIRAKKAQQRRDLMTASLEALGLK